MPYSPNGARYDLNTADMLQLMNGHYPPEQEGPAQDAYFQLLCKRIIAVHGSDAMNDVWLLACGDCEPWERWTTRVSRRNTEALHKNKSKE